MSTAAAAATGPDQDDGTGHLGSLPLHAGRVPGPGHPLALGRRTRARLRGAVQELLAAPGLVGADDAVRLAAVVLTARSPARAGSSGAVEIRSGELGRWLGLSQSYLASIVLPALRDSGAVTTQPITGTAGEHTGLACRVLPLLAARGTPGPLALTRAELATLLRLIEALFAPGWVRLDGRPAPAGLLGARTGRGAATDRLALLLLALEATEQGRVRLCGGRIDQRHGRPAVTLAGLLGCTPRSARRVLERLEERGVAVRVRRHTVSGMLHRSRLVVPAVAVAHGRHTPAAPGPGCGKPDSSDPLVAAGDSSTHQPWVMSRVTGISKDIEPEVTDLPAAAPLHTDHSPEAGAGREADLDDGFSGEAEVGASDHRPERARAREDGQVDAGTSAPLRTVSGPHGAQRGEQRPQSREVVPKTQRPSPRPSLVPAPPPDLMRAMRPVICLWRRLDRRGTREVVVAAVRKELTTLAGVSVLVSPDVRLAERLRFRLDQQGSHGSIANPAGWLIGPGLRQRSGCGDVRCDDAVLLDSGEPCPRCEDNLAGKRALRRQVFQQVVGEVQGARWEQVRVLAEARLRDLAALAARDDVARLEHARQIAAEREAAAEQRRVRAASTREAREAMPCQECGRERAAGLCGICEDVRARKRTIALAVEIAVAGWADLEDQADVDAVADQARRETQTTLDQTLDDAANRGALPETLARLALLTLQNLAAEYNHGALNALANNPGARQRTREARVPGAPRYPSRHETPAAATLAARRPQDSAARELLAERLARVQARTSDWHPANDPAVASGPQEARGWSCARQRCQRQHVGVPPVSRLCVPCLAKAGPPGAAWSARRRAEAAVETEARVVQ